MNIGLLITTWNRTPQLRRTLERVLELTPPADILVVDDGGEDGCEQLCQEMSDRLPIRYIYTHNPGLALCSHARNVGIRNMDADVLIISEPECKFLTDVVAQVRDRFEHDVLSAGIVYHAQHEWMVEPQQCNRIEGWVAPYTAAYPREALMAVGGWVEFDMPGAWGFDDIDLLTRLRIAGYGQVIDREIEVLHQWHVNPGRDNVGAMANDAWWRTRNYDEEYNQDSTAIVANKGREWGVVKPR